MKIAVKDAVKVLTEEIKKDKDFYYSYQANIAMAFVDEYRRNTKKYKNYHEIHTIANTAAKNFLNMWIK